MNLDRVQTNIIIFEVPDRPAEDVVEALADEEVLLTPFGPHTLRAVTHRDVSMDDIDAALTAARSIYG